MAHHDFYFFEPYKCTCLLRLVIKLLLRTQPTFLPWHFVLCQRPSSEEGCSVFLPVLAMIEMWRGKKLVECSMDQRAVHDSERGTRSLSRDEGSYMLSHTYDRFLATSLSIVARTGRTEQASDRDRNVKVKMLVVYEVIVLSTILTAEGCRWWKCAP